MRRELIEFGIQMGIPRLRIEEVCLRGQALGQITGSNPAWVKAVADSPDMTPVEKTYLAFIIAAVLVEAGLEKTGVISPSFTATDSNDPMFR